VLISGASGFLPAYMVETLLYRNEVAMACGKKATRVLALVRNLAKARLRFAAYDRRNDLVLVEGDVCDPPNVQDHVDFIVHAASNASPKYFSKDPVGTVSANVLGTHHMLALARRHNSERFLFFSSGEVYGRVQPRSHPIRESDYGYLDPTDVRFCYGESKRMGENMCVAWFHQFGVPVNMVRPGHTYGPGMALDDGRVFADFVADIVSRRHIVMKSDGTAVRCFCYLADATAGFFTALLAGTPGQAYNVANPAQCLTILELAELTASLFPDRGLRVIRRPPELDTIVRTPVIGNPPDISKIRDLGWEPGTDARDGFRRTVLSFEQPHFAN
jgi:nucleoside-diphosphate-sugar epimerase